MESDSLLAIDGAGHLLEFFDLFQKACRQDLVAVFFGPSATPRSVRRLGWGPEVVHAVVLDPRYKMVSLRQLAANHFALGIVGVCD